MAVSTMLLLEEPEEDSVSIQEIAADVTLRAVFAGDVVPAVHQTVDGDDGAGAPQ